MRSPSLLLFPVVAACASPNAVEVDLSPSVISSLDGKTTISALVSDNTTPLADQNVHVTVDYTDRNGTPHMIAPLDGKTDSNGVFRQTVDGLIWDGVGTVTVEHSSAATGAATFSVLDRTPPKVTILPPTTDKHVGPGLPLDVQVHVTDEIGISEVILDSNANINGQRFTVVASGSQDATLTFRIDVPANATAGPSIQLFALATDLSGNTSVADAMTLTVDPAISIATPPGLTGTLLVDGTTTQLVSPRSIAASPMDGHLYVADVAGTGLCNPSCVWRVDPTSGAIDAIPVFVGAGAIEGVAFDATGATMYVSDRPNRIVQLTYATTAYGTPVVCDNVAQQRPQDPYHLVFDATLGILAVDGNRKELERVATCAVTTVGTAASMNGNFDQPRGVALDPAGAIYMSDQNNDRVYAVDRTTGAVTVSGSGVAAPYGIEWLAGGTTQFADTLMVASGDRVVESMKGSGLLAAAYLRTTPMDLAFITGSMFVVTAPGNAIRGRIYKVAGF